MKTLKSRELRIVCVRLNMLQIPLRRAERSVAFKQLRKHLLQFADHAFRLHDDRRTALDAILHDIARLQISFIDA